MNPPDELIIGAVREEEAGGMYGRNLWSALFFATGLLAFAAVLPFALDSSRTPSVATVVALIVAYVAASQ